MLKNLLKSTIRKLNGRLTIKSMSHKTIYTQLHGKRNLVDTYLIFLSYIPILTQLILRKVTHRDQIPLSSHVPIFMIQAMFKTRKLVPVLTQLYYILQILNRMVKVRTLRPPQTWLKMIIPNKCSSQALTLKLHVNPCQNHHSGRVTTLQHLRSMILLLKKFRKSNLDILEAVTTIYVLILILLLRIIQQILTCAKKEFSPFLRVKFIICHSHSPIFCTHIIQLLLVFFFNFFGANAYTN